MDLKRFMRLNKLKIGDKVKEIFGAQVIEVIGFEPGLIENVITQYTDPEGNVITAKFMDSGLEAVTEDTTGNS